MDFSYCSFCKFLRFWKWTETHCPKCKIRYRDLTQAEISAIIDKDTIIEVKENELPTN